MSKNSLIKHILPNTSGGLVILSTSESLLLAINAYRKENVGISLILKLYKLYLEGVKTEGDRRLISQINEVLTDKNYTVLSDPRITNEDSTKRYFETHLAYHSLQNKAEELDHDELEAFTQNLKSRLLSLPDKDGSHIKVEHILKGNRKEKRLNKYEKEYAQLIAKLTKNDFHGLSAKACKNLLQIACATSLVTLNTQVDTSMPVDIYANSIFTMGMDGRGRISKKSNDNVRTTAKGLMKSTSPLMMYGDVANAVGGGYSRKTDYSPFQRSVDQSDFMLENQWVQHLFSHQTQVYSNGISSTTLAQIRNMILEKRLGHSYYKGSFQKHMTAFASLMVYNSGGHSFFEIFEVLKMRLCLELIDTESATLEALVQDNLMYKWFYVDQPDVFEKALDATLKYLHVILAKKILSAQFKRKSMVSLLASEQQMTLHRAVVNASMQEFDHLISSASQEAIDSPNDNNWTALMVAAQLGKTEHVKKIIAAGAAVGKQVQTLSALEAAIKCGHYDTVFELLKADAPVKRSFKIGGGIQINAPALYFACRQFDVRILKLILEHDDWLDIEDKKEAVLVALKIENLDALHVLVEHINKEERGTFVTATYQSELLKEAVCLGSLRLIRGIMDFDIGSSSDKLDHQLLLNTAAEKGFLPTVELLLDLFKNPENSKKEPLIKLEVALIKALENHHVKVAECLVIFGAHCDEIPSNASYLHEFAHYLKNSKFKSFFLVEDTLGDISIKLKHTSQTLIEEYKGVDTKKSIEKATEEIGGTAIINHQYTKKITNEGLNFSMIILGGFIAVAGIAAVAVAYTLLNAAIFVTAGLVVASIGVVAVLSEVGLFATGACKNRQIITEDSEDSLDFLNNPVHQ